MTFCWSRELIVPTNIETSKKRTPKVVSDAREILATDDSLLADLWVAAGQL
jgi:hypothetical protein